MTDDDEGSFDIPELHCPWCGFKFNTASVTDRERKAPPTDGDGVLCIGCACPSIFVVANGVTSLRKTNDVELNAFVTLHQDLIEALRTFHDMYPDLRT